MDTKIKVTHGGVSIDLEIPGDLKVLTDQEILHCTEEVLISRNSSSLQVQKGALTGYVVDRQSGDFIVVRPTVTFG